MNEQSKTDIDRSHDETSPPLGYAPALEDGTDMAALWIRYHPRLKLYIAARLGETEAEDLTQDIFLSLFRRNGIGRVQTDVEAYLLGMARNLVAQHLRNKRRRPIAISIEEIESMEVRRESEPDSKLGEEILVALERMSPKAREAIRLRFLEGLDPQDAARQAGCTVRVFYKRVHKGITTLRKLVHSVPAGDSKLKGTHP